MPKHATPKIMDTDNMRKINDCDRICKKYAQQYASFLAKYATRIYGYAEMKNNICLKNVNWIHRKKNIFFV